MPPSVSDAIANPQSIYGSRKAPLSLDIIVVGCGISGLSAAFCLTQAGHRVTIVESSPVMGPDVGAGMLTSPNSSRLLHRWCSAKRLEGVAVKGKCACMRRYSTGELIGCKKWEGVMERDYGAPFYHFHRADLHEILRELVASRVTVVLGSPVVGCDPGPVAPSVTLESGRVLNADLIIGADGLKSYIQQVVLGKSNRAESTGDAAWRALVPSSLMMQDPELREFIESPGVTAWLGPGRHLVGYPVRNGEIYNLVLSHPDDGVSVESWAAQGNVEEMRRSFDDYEPRVRKILGLVQSNLKFRLLDRQPLEKWSHDSGRVTLLGDACHPMLPYRAQGAAMGIEDAAVLGNLLSRISHISQLKPLLQAYQDLRLKRTSAAQETSRADQHFYHLPDGEEQRRRDENMKKAMALEMADKSDELRHQALADGVMGRRKASDDLLFSYDADVEVDKWWASHGDEVEALAKSSSQHFAGGDATFACIVCVCAFSRQELPCDCRHPLVTTHPRVSPAP